MLKYVNIILFRKVIIFSYHLVLTFLHRNSQRPFNEIFISVDYCLNRRFNELYGMIVIQVGHKIPNIRRQRVPSIVGMLVVLSLKGA